MSDMYFVVKALDKTKNRVIKVNIPNIANFNYWEVNPQGQAFELDAISDKEKDAKLKRKGKRARQLTGQAKGAVTLAYKKRYPEQAAAVQARLDKLKSIDPKLADQYRDNLQSILLQDLDNNNAAKLAERTLGSTVVRARAQKSSSLAKPLAELEQEVAEGKIARKAGKIVGQVEGIRRRVVSAEPEAITKAKGAKGDVTQIVERFKGTSFGKFLQREIKRAEVLASRNTTRREFLEQAGKTLALGGYSVAKLPEEISEIAGGYAFNGVFSKSEVGAFVKGTQKALFDAVQGGLTVLTGGQLTPEARKEIEDNLEKLGKQYNSFVDNLPDWAKEKYDEIGRYKISRRQFFGGKGGKYPTVDVEAQEIVDSVDNPKGQKLSPNKQGLARRNRRGIEKSIQRTITANPILPRELTNEQLFPGRKSLKGSDRFVQDALVKRQQEVLVDARTASTKNTGTKIAKGVSTTVERTPAVTKPIPSTQSAQPKLNKLFAKRLLIGSGIAALAGGGGYAYYRNKNKK